MCAKLGSLIIQIAIVLALSFATIQPAVADGVCGELFARSIEQQKGGLERLLPTWFGGSDKASTRAQDAGPLSESPVWVTITEGTAQTIDCKTSTTGSIYFPIGMVLTPVYDLESLEGAYGLFLSEHGLHVILRRRAASPVRDEDIYFFADGIGQYDVCVNSVSRNPDCDRFAPDNASSVGLSAKFGYVAGQRSAETDARVALFREWQRLEQDHVLNDGPDPMEQLTTAEVELVCAPFTAGAHRNRGLRPSDGEGYDTVSLSLCTKPPEGSGASPGRGFARKPIKIVTKDGVEQQLSETWNSMIFRRVDSVSPILTALRKGATDFRSRKDCRGELKTEDFHTLGYSAGASTGDWGFVDVGVKLVISKKSRFKEVFESGQMFIVSAHMFQKKLGSDRSVASALFDVYDIWLVMKCNEENTRPVKVQYIVIYHPEVTDGFIRFFPEDIAEVFQEYKADTGNYGEQSLRMTIRNLDNGVLWMIKDYQEYYFWRDLLRDFIAGDPKVQDLFTRFPDRKADILEFFVHLTMAAVFQSSVPTYLPQGVS